MPKKQQADGQEQLTVRYRSTDALIPYARNSRTHSTAQVEQIAAAIKEFGWTNPVLVDGANGIIAGHGRVMAARLLGMDQVPTIELAHLTDEQKRAYVIADNQLGLLAGWDDELLRSELDALSDVGFDVSLIGFGHEDGPAEGGAKSGVSEIGVSEVADRFWISVKGPLKHQHQALVRLRELLAELPVEIALGTTPVEGTVGLE